MLKSTKYLIGILQSFEERPFHCSLYSIILIYWNVKLVIERLYSTLKQIISCVIFMTPTSPSL